MREMMQYLKPYWKGLIAATVAVAVSTVCDLLLPAIMSEILNRGVYQADFAYIVKCCAIMAAVALVGLGTVILGAKFPTTWWRPSAPTSAPPCSARSTR